MGKKIKEFLYDNAPNIIVGFFITFIVIGIFWLMYKVDEYEEQIWNNGNCSCGGKWEYVEATENVHGFTGKNGVVTTSHRYIYRCSNCGKMEEFSELR